MAKESLNNDQKLDLILKYTRSAHRWAVVRGVVSMLFFLIFFVLPIIGSFYLVDYAQKNVNWNEVKGNFEQMKDQFKQLQGLSLQLGGADVQNAQQALPRTPNR